MGEIAVLKRKHPGLVDKVYVHELGDRRVEGSESSSDMRGRDRVLVLWQAEFHLVNLLCESLAVGFGFVQLALELGDFRLQVVLLPANLIPDVGELPIVLLEYGDFLFLAIELVAVGAQEVLGQGATTPLRNLDGLCSRIMTFVLMSRLADLGKGLLLAVAGAVTQRSFVCTVGHDLLCPKGANVFGMVCELAKMNMSRG